MSSYSNVDYSNIKMSYAVAAVNDYNNKIIKSSEIFIHINNRNPYVKKEDGFFIFVDKYMDAGISNDALASQLKSNDAKASQLKSNDAKASQLRIYAEGTLYQPKGIYMNTGKDDDYGKIIYMRLLPNKMYPVSDNATVIKGKGEPRQVLYLLFSCKGNPYIISSDYNQDNIIKIFHEKDNKLTAMTFFVDSKETGCFVSIGDALHLEQDTSEYNQSYKIIEEHRLNREYEPNSEYALGGMNLQVSTLQANTYLKRLYTVKADKNGEFYFLVPKEAEADCEFEYSIKGEKGSFIKMKLCKNSVNDIGF